MTPITGAMFPQGQFVAYRISLALETNKILHYHSQWPSKDQKENDVCVSDSRLYHIKSDITWYDAIWSIKKRKQRKEKKKKRK